MNLKPKARTNTTTQIMQRIKKNTIKIAYWNANAISNKKQELEYFIQKYKIDAVLVQETHLKPHRKLNLPNHQIYRNDRENQKGGGTAIIINRLIKHHLLPTPTTKALEVTGLSVETDRGELHLYSLYYPPKKEFHQTDFDSIKNENKDTIAAGDLNARNKHWNSKRNCPRGKTLHHFITSNNMEAIGPEDPTHHYEEGSDVIDIAIVKNINNYYHLQTVEELSSDHSPVIITLNRPIKQDKITKSWTNWKQFQETIKTTNSPINNPQEIENAVKQLEIDIKQAYEQATYVKEIQPKQLLPQHIQQLIQTKNKARRRYHRTLDPNDKTHLNRAANELKQALREHSNKKWTTLLENTKIEDNSLWRLTKKLKQTPHQTIPPLEKQNRTAITDEDKLEMIAETFEEQFTPNQANTLSQTKDIEIHTAIYNLERTIPTTPIPTTTTEEINQIIQNLPPKKAPGPDQITNKMLKQLNEQAITKLTEIINAIFKHRHFPKDWKKSHIILIHKKGKPTNNPTSYRPISLLNTMGKVTEKIILKHLKEEIQKLSIIPPEQFGFRTEHSTTLQLTKLTEKIKNDWNKHQATAAIYLDVEKAFDRVWHAALIHKLTKFKVSTPLTQLISHYLQGRTFQIKINKKLSSRKTAYAGVPQGSILGPILYSIYTADLPQLPDRTSIALFADDTAITATSINPNRAAKILQKAVNTMTNWFDTWRISINPTKTVAILHGVKTKKTKTNLQIKNTQLQWTEKTKYLGIHLDRKLKYTHHIRETAKKAKQIIAALYPLANRKSTLNKHNKILIYKQIIRPVITYGAEIWSTTAKSNLKIIEQIQNAYLRRALDAPPYMRNTQIQRETKTEPIKVHIQNMKIKLQEKIKNHPNAELRKITITP
jgi:hypothetical protein